MSSSYIPMGDESTPEDGHNAQQIRRFPSPDHTVDESIEFAYSNNSDEENDQFNKSDAHEVSMMDGEGYNDGGSYDYQAQEHYTGPEDYAPHTTHNLSPMQEEDTTDYGQQPTTTELPSFTSLPEFVNASFPTFESLADAPEVLGRYESTLDPSGAGSGGHVQTIRAGNDIIPVVGGIESASDLKTHYLREFTRLKASFYTGVLSDYKRTKKVCENLTIAMNAAPNPLYEGSVWTSTAATKGVGIVKRGSFSGAGVGAAGHDEDTDVNSNSDMGLDDFDELDGPGGFDTKSKSKLLKISANDYQFNDTPSHLFSADSLTSAAPLLTYKRTSIWTASAREGQSARRGTSTLKSPLAGTDEDMDDNSENDDVFSPNVRESEASSLPDFSQVKNIELLQLRLKRLIGAGNSVIYLKDFEIFKTKIILILRHLEEFFNQDQHDQQQNRYRAGLGKEDDIIPLYQQMIQQLSKLNNQVEYFINTKVFPGNGTNLDTISDVGTGTQTSVYQSLAASPVPQDENTVDMIEKTLVDSLTERPSVRFNELSSAILDISLYAVSTCKELQKHIRAHFTRQLQTSLKKIKWPKSFTNMDVKRLFSDGQVDTSYIQKYLTDLIKLQVIELSVADIVQDIFTKNEVRSKNGTWPLSKLELTIRERARESIPREPLILYGIQQLLKIPILQFNYHFDSDRPTNRLDKPEWPMRHLAKQFDEHYDFLTSIVQYSLQDGGYIPESKIFNSNAVRIGYLDAKTQFIAGMLLAYRHKLMNDLDALLEYPQYFTDTISALVKFDNQLRDGFDYLDSPITAASVFLDNSSIFEEWITLLRESFEEKINEALLAPDAFDPAYPGVNDQESRIMTKSADLFITLQDNLTEQYDILENCKLQRKIALFTEVELPILENFLKQIVEMHKKLDLSLYSIAARNATALTLMDSKSLILLCKYCTSLQIVKEFMIDKSKVEFYTEFNDQPISAVNNTGLQMDPLADNRSVTSSNDTSNAYFDSKERVESPTRKGKSPDKRDTAPRNPGPLRDNVDVFEDAVQSEEEEDDELRRANELLVGSRKKSLKSGNIPLSAFQGIISIYDEFISRMETSISNYIFELAVFSLRECVMRTNWTVASNGETVGGDYVGPSSGRSNQSPAGGARNADVGRNPGGWGSFSLSQGEDGLSIEDDEIDGVGLSSHAIPVPETYGLLELFDKILPMLRNHLPQSSFNKIIRQVIDERLDSYIFENVIQRGRFNYDGAQLLRGSLSEWFIGKVVAKHLPVYENYMASSTTMLRMSLDTLQGI